MIRFVWGIFGLEYWVIEKAPLVKSKKRKKGTIYQGFKKR